MSKFLLPPERIPKPFSQDIKDENGKLISNIGSCVACTFTKILEVLNYIKTGEYISLSKGYMYGRNNYPNKSSEGMNEEYTLNVLLKRGSVPQGLCPEYEEIPEIVQLLNAKENIEELDKLAEDYKIKSWENIGSRNLFENVKKYLEEKKMPLAVTISKWRNWGNHCVVAVGYEDDYILWQDHDGTDKINKLSQKRFSKAYYLEGDFEMTDLKKYTPAEYEKYLDSFNFTRTITKVQLHHTYSPKITDFNGNNHIELQKGMQSYHINSCGYSDIGQNLTIFPDGTVVTGRSLNTKPAGIKNANSGAVCIECIGNFDKEEMPVLQRDAIARVVRAFLKKCNLNPAQAVVYHAWYSSDGNYLGDYNKELSQKSCPGAKFFGGNTRSAFEKNLLPLLREAETLKKVETINDIIWVLAAHKIITDSKLWMKKCEEDINVYWLCYKMANKLQGTSGDV